MLGTDLCYRSFELCLKYFFHHGQRSTGRKRNVEKRNGHRHTQPGFAIIVDVALPRGKISLHDGEIARARGMDHISRHDHLG